MDSKIDVNTLLVGKWTHADPWNTMVHSISVTNNCYEVAVYDSEDEEFANIYDIKWDGDKLRYSSYWNSSGRLLKNILQLVEADKVSLTYTYTDHDTLNRCSD